MLFSSSSLVLWYIFSDSLTQVQLDEYERVVSELRSSLKRSGLELDRKLTAQQQEYETKIQKLLQQLSLQGTGGAGGAAAEGK